MLTPYLRKPPAKFIGTITSLKRKPTRIKTTLSVMSVHSVLYQFGKEKIIDYFAKAGGYAIRNVSRIARLGYNYCLPGNKLVTAEELNMHVTLQLENCSHGSIIVKIKMSDGIEYVGDIYSTTSDKFELRCWRPDLSIISIAYARVSRVYFMGDGSEYEIVR